MKKLICVICFNFFIYNVIEAQKIEIKSNFWGTTFYYKNKEATLSRLLNISKNNKEAYKYFAQAKANKNVSDILTFTGGFLIGWPIGTKIGGGKPNWNLAYFGAGLAAISIPLSATFVKKSKKGIEIFNSDKTTYFNRKVSKFYIVAAPTKIGLQYLL